MRVITDARVLVCDTNPLRDRGALKEVAEADIIIVGGRIVKNRFGDIS